MEVSIFGIGPLLVLIGGTILAVILLLQYAFGVAIALPSPWADFFRILGIPLGAIGVYFWVSSALLITRAFRSHRLETTGVYRLSRNPMYAGFIVFIVPGIAFLFNNLLILGTSVGIFAAFKLRIGKEEAFLQREFGEAFQRYAREVPQLIPFVRL